MSAAYALFDRMAALVGRNLPPGVSPSYFQGFVRRNRPALVAVLDRHLRVRTGTRIGAQSPDAPDLWSASERTAANLRAMRIAASERPDEMSAADRAAALEPAAGIGRFVQAAAGPGFEDLRWLVVEWSELSARMLQALRPDLAVFNGPFERWVREHGPEYAGRLGLVVSNPPSASAASRSPRIPTAPTARRTPTLTSCGARWTCSPPTASACSSSRAASFPARLKRHHLTAAYRLPSAIFPGAMLVTDLLFLQARGGELAEVDEVDQFVLDGDYFQQFPAHVLGTEVGRDAGDDDQTEKPRWGYQVVGTFDRLPDLVERPICGACEIAHEVIPFPGPKGRKAARGGVTRQTDDATAGLSEHAASALALGLRVDRFLAALAAEASDEHVQHWSELTEALRAWVKKHGNPWASRDLRKLAQGGHVGAELFLARSTRAAT